MSEDINYSHSVDVKKPIYLHAEKVVDVYCEKVDETKSVLGVKYIYNCPMCGEEIWSLVHD